MKTSVKIAIIGAIATVLAAVISAIIPIIYQNGDKGAPEKPGVTPTAEQGNISVNKSGNVVIGNITTEEGDVIIGGTKTTNVQALPEGQDSETRRENGH
ncbi:MAG: hypothetical protein L3J18_11060 [Candidatus Brocadia sp.]|jgi:hypothetical protein|uniref:Uncharacterized protein n=1 Tax=Candidatus Brocadia fulgida TaxID=380242 RepID=A0A0M2UZ10_9BACT|nr:MAG: hypothetical protein BROFUL_00223 [Candidatus Brocadia fulgida]UJS19450.1 MAG: hypothetical protein L3J18_11060 [Candidatus Brocadia sp.]